MTTPLVLEIKLDNYEQLKERFDPGIVRKSFRSAVSRTSKKLQTKASKHVRERYNVLAKDLRKGSPVVNVKLNKTAEGTSLSYIGKRVGYKTYKGKKIYVKKGHKGTGKTAKNRIYDSVAAKVLKTGRVRRVEGKHGFGAFHARGRAGFANGKPSPNSNYKQTVFERQTKSRLSIRKVTFPAIPQIVGQELVSINIDKSIAEELDKQFESAMVFHLKKASGIL